MLYSSTFIPVNDFYKIYNGEKYKVLKAEISNGAGKIGTVLDDYLEIR